MAAFIYLLHKADVCPGILEDEISNDSRITKDLNFINVEDNYDITFSFNSELTQAEEEYLLEDLTNHDCSGTNDGNDDELNSGDFANLPCVQLRNTSGQLLINTSPETFEFNVKEVETDPEIILSTNDLNSITINYNGLYHLSFSVPISLYEESITAYLFDETTQTVIQNTTTTIETSKGIDWKKYPQYYAVPTDVKLLSINSNVILAAGAVITVKIFFTPIEFNPNRCNSQPSTSVEYHENAYFSVVKLQGSVGEQGVPGTAGRDGNTQLSVQKNDANVVQDYKTLNFEGNVTVIDDGQSKATIVIDNNNNTGIVSGFMTDVHGVCVPGVFIYNSAGEKYQSIETINLMYSESSISRNDWCQIDSANRSTSGYISNFDGTIVGVSFNCDKHADELSMDLYINNTNKGVIISGSGANDDRAVNNDLSIDFNSNDLIRLRGSSSMCKSVGKVLITLLIKWRKDQ